MADNLWTRRNNSGKLSLSTPGQGPFSSAGTDSSRNGSISKRPGDSSHGGKNPFGSATTPGGTNVASPTTSATNAFGLGSGAFASFGSAKTPKTPGGNPLDAIGTASGSKTPAADRTGDPLGKARSMASIAENAVQAGAKPGMASQSSSARASSEVARPQAGPQSYPLEDEWVTWCRPCQPKGQPYEEYAKSLSPMVHCKTIEEFWLGFKHIKQPSQMPVGWEYHFFKRGIRPIWEDDVNRNGGKWVLRLKKGIADRYWELTRIALIGAQFQDVGADICGAVVSIRNGEDVISIWTRATGGRVLKIRDIWRNCLECPANTILDFKKHHESIQQRAAIDESRRDKQGGDKRKQATIEKLQS